MSCFSFLWNFVSQWNESNDSSGYFHVKQSQMSLTFPDMNSSTGLNKHIVEQSLVSGVVGIARKNTVHILGGFGS